MNNLLNKTKLKLNKQVDGSFLSVFRSCFGFVMLMKVSSWFHYGWIEKLFINPEFHFKYYGFSWVKEFPEPIMWLVFILLGLSAIGMTLGYKYKLSNIILFFCWTYVFLLDQSYYNNHYYLFALVAFLLIFLPSGKERSVPNWSLWSLRLLVGLPYFFGGLAKINLDWLQGEPMRMLLVGKTSFPIIGRFFEYESFVYFLSYSGLMIDLLAVPLLLIRRTRVPMFVVISFYHFFNSQLFSIGFFPIFMVLATFVFFDPDWPRILCKKIGLNFTDSNNIEYKFNKKIISFILVPFFLVQLVLPFRHHLYPGNVFWNQDGRRFSWLMFTAVLQAKSKFYIVDQSGTQWTYDPLDTLTVIQNDGMKTDPDRILQFAHYLSTTLRSKGIYNTQIFVYSRMQLNNREEGTLVKDQIDLLSVKRNLLPSTNWVNELTIPLR